MPTRGETSRRRPSRRRAISPTLSRVTNVDAMPGAVALEELDRLKCVPTATISWAPFS